MNSVPPGIVRAPARRTILATVPGAVCGFPRKPERSSVFGTSGPGTTSDRRTRTVLLIAASSLCAKLSDPSPVQRVSQRKPERVARFLFASSVRRRPTTLASLPRATQGNTTTLPTR